MHAYRIVWEDESKAREVEILVHYTLEGGTVAIDAICPTKVTLFGEHTPQPTRVLPVHTPTGRRLLAEAYLASRETTQSLEEEILIAHEARDGAVALA
ncbi:MAG: hypothetical protein WD872_21325 [Pirellulaceae bacterium]